MSSNAADRPFFRLILVWAALVIVVAGMRASASLVVPFLLSLFLAILCGPPLEWLMKRGLQRTLAMLLVLVSLCFVVLVLASVVVKSANDFINEWPETYQPKAEALAENWKGRIKQQMDSSRWLQALSSNDEPDDAAATDFNGPADDPTESEVETNDPLPGIGSEDPLDDASDPLLSLESDPTEAAGARTQWSDWIEPNVLMRTFTTGMRAVSSILSQTLLILVMTIFLLVEAATLPAKLQAISGEAPSRIDRLRRIAEEVNRYMAIKTSTSLITGTFVTVALWWLDVDFALLWGMTAFLLNYVPNIGSIIAAVPAVLMALLQHEMGTAAGVIGLYVAVNMFIGYFLEPRWMGRGLGLSTLVVFVSLVFWGWVLGPVGMVISVPLTMAVKIALEGSNETRWLAILMGPGVR